MERDESSTDAATAIYFICILLQPFGFDLTFCSGSCGRIHVRSRPKALLKIDKRKIRQTKFVGSFTYATYDTSFAAEGLFVHHLCSLRERICVRVQAGYFGHTGWGGALSVGHVLFLTIHPHPSEKEREKATGPVQINYSNHLEDSEKERRGGRKSGTQQQAVGTHCVTLRLSNMITAFVMLHNPTFFNSVCQHWLF